MGQKKITVNAGGGSGFFALLAILFIALKLLDVINWSWWWVLLPIWGPVALTMAVLIPIGIVAVVIMIFRKKH